MQKSTPPRIDLYFDFSSPYSYLSVARVHRITQPLNITVRLLPIALGAIFQKLGWQSSPFLAQPRKLDYMWTDVARQARKYHLEFRQPTQFPVGSIQAARIANAYADASWHDSFCLQVLRAYFVHNQDIAQPEVISRILRGLDLNPEETMANASAEESKGLLRALTAQADALNVFGAPSLVVGQELFWGDDRLEDAVACCLSNTHERLTV
ncbi:2-hydroxychromene-2-carboxylate isomerase [Limnobacter humi]|uniref:2-hydroxychromene-2-carboxylate isomerase n=1 Tax=Limnobacter humi TaxID=1778671 RepID=A0ABT1WJ84_9BURK|nr:2-hydroxychromene-2-carboxylate isomerase [Limnobacter humi]MCQ8896484.1 2-hydroxychromene-2-carboxylate isomerase [Limnobacter humi]